MRHIDYTFTLQTRDVPGVLVRIAQVFARRGCNILSLHVQPPRNSEWAVITVDAYDIPRPDQIKHQLEKLVDVNQVATHKHTVEEVV